MSALEEKTALPAAPVCSAATVGATEGPAGDTELPALVSMEMVCTVVMSSELSLLFPGAAAAVGAGASPFGAGASPLDDPDASVGSAAFGATSVGDPAGAFGAASLGAAAGAFGASSPGAAAEAFGASPVGAAGAFGASPVGAGACGVASVVKASVTKVLVTEVTGTSSHLSPSHDVMVKTTVSVWVPGATTVVLASLCSETGQ